MPSACRSGVCSVNAFTILGHYNLWSRDASTCPCHLCFFLGKPMEPIFQGWMNPRGQSDRKKKKKRFSSNAKSNHDPSDRETRGSNYYTIYVYTVLLYWCLLYCYIDVYCIVILMSTVLCDTCLLYSYMHVECIGICTSTVLSYIRLLHCHIQAYCTVIYTPTVLSYKRLLYCNVDV